MNTRKNILMMAVAKGQQSGEAAEIKRYIGVGAVNILAVNPTKAQIKELMGYEPQEEPTYVGVQEVDGKAVNFARVDFVVRTDEEKTGINCTGRVSFFVRNQYVRGSQSGKYQVIDNYTNTAWATEDIIKAKEQVMYANGPAKLIGAYRPAYVGEWALMNFIRQYLCIGSSGETNGYDYINGTWVEKTGDALNDCECSLSVEEIQNMFKGNFSPIKDAIALQPTNKVKLLFGIKVDTSVTPNREYQDIYTGYVLRNNANNYSKLQEKVEDAKNNGGLSNRIYEFCDLKEYKVEATPFNNTPEAEDPFANAATEKTPW